MTAPANQDTVELGVQDAQSARDLRWATELRTSLWLTNYVFRSGGLIWASNGVWATSRPATGSGDLAVPAEMCDGTPMSVTGHGPWVEVRKHQPEYGLGTGTPTPDPAASTDRHQMSFRSVPHISAEAIPGLTHGFRRWNATTVTKANLLEAISGTEPRVDLGAALAAVGRKGTEAPTAEFDRDLLTTVIGHAPGTKLVVQTRGRCAHTIITSGEWRGVLAPLGPHRPEEM